MTANVALIGAGGHGMWHRRRIAPLHDSGRLRLVALCDVAGVADAEDAPIPAGTGVYADHRAMLRGAHPDVVVICTPPHTHLPIALDAVGAGGDVLLEKPPVLSLAEHAVLSDALAETGRVCQVGFQALGSAALAELAAALADGRLGTVTGVSAAAAWQRDTAYYARAAWVGRRSLGGRPVLDGALANPFAHALMLCLALSGGASPVSVEIERYRTRRIEVDDTACLRVTLHSGQSIVVAVTLCGEGFIPGEILVHGTKGSAALEYPADRLRLPGDGGPREVPGRLGLLENLLDHRADPSGAPLIAPLDRTAGFTAVVEAIQEAPPPEPIAAEWLVVDGGTVTVSGVNAAIRAAADRLALFSELDAPWAVKPHRAVTGGCA